MDIEKVKQKAVDERREGGLSEPLTLDEAVTFICSKHDKPTTNEGWRMQYRSYGRIRGEICIKGYFRKWLEREIEKARKLCERAETVILDKEEEHYAGRLSALVEAHAVHGLDHDDWIAYNHLEEEIVSTREPICLECKHSTFLGFDIWNPDEEWGCKADQRRHPVTGDTQYRPCSIKNCLGDCQDFEPEES